MDYEPIPDAELERVQLLEGILIAAATSGGGPMDILRWNSNEGAVLRRSIGVAGIIAAAALVTWRLTEAAIPVASPWNSAQDNADAAPVATDVQKAVVTQNPNICDPEDILVQKYKNNLVMFLDADKGKVQGTGIFTAECSKIISVGHVFYHESSSTSRVPNMSLQTRTVRGGYVTTPVRDGKLSEGKWRETDLYKDEVATLTGPKNNGCGAVRIMKADGEATIRRLAANDVPFFILKFDNKTGICAQKCNILPYEEHKPKQFAGTVGHDCSTSGGNSGSPIFARSKNGAFEAIVGLHVGARRDRNEHNVFIIVNNEDVYP